MKSTDRFLVAIVAGIIVLVGVAIAIALLRPQPGYLPEDTPGGVTNNYVLALQKQDYPRAYGYLSPDMDGYPRSAEDFTDEILAHAWYFGRNAEAVSMEVVSERVNNDRATVVVSETHFSGGGLFESNEFTQTFEVQLQRDAQEYAWKIVRSDSYWAPCWNDPNGC